MFMCERSVLVGVGGEKETAKKPLKTLQENVSLTMKDMHERFSLFILYIFLNKEKPYIMYH